MVRALPGATVEGLLAQRVAHAVRAAWDVSLTPAQALLRPSQVAGVDFQSNAAMGLAKRLGRPPREVAEGVAAALFADGVLEPPEVSGPGFLNLVLRPAFLAGRLAALAADPRLGVPEAERRERVVVDYSAPNAAKEMQAHHLRSTVLGDAIARLMEFLGHEVVRQNHLGDWGTQMGLLVEHAVETGGGPEPGAMTEFYRAARLRFDGDPEFADRARRRTAELQSGDPDSRRIWRSVMDASVAHLQEVYALLGVGLTPEDVRGESFYQPLLGPLVERLEAAGLAEESDGALCAFPAGFAGRDGAPVPVMLRKRDGGYTYDTTDLAAVQYRVDELKADRSYYVVGAPQQQHFATVFAVAREAGVLPADADFRQVSFGSVLGADGRMLKTRSAGGTVEMLDLLREGVRRAAAMIAERNAGRSTGEETADGIEDIARAVGIGAVKYADLSVDRERDAVFSFDRMLAMDGNTGVYLQYARARMGSVLRRGAAAGVPEGPITADALGEPAERTLALALLGLPGAVLETAETLRPHRLCRQLFEVAQAFSGFWESCPVLGAERPEVRAARLGLCGLSGRALELGLGLLGVEAPERL
ncbi:arginine--tRNA ligase [Mangrovactinospora gilvigrisea]|uniref:Arginine--tRNA ligase n=2 Tax=Mangrovactinospora gilvigrisea TaxID=1428644 RepID=A0A1J7BUW3_9ACTN|nr:arginine--tRNA ligase [Mangrovactinospora gilvigrisea]